MSNIQVIRDPAYSRTASQEDPYPESGERPNHNPKRGAEFFGSASDKEWSWPFQKMLPIVSHLGQRMDRAQ